MEENKNIEPEQPAENIPKGIIPSQENMLPEAAIITEPHTEEMEVHHHTHASHGKKKWKSYFWEFLMLFLAVFCGFLAEYKLEHVIEQQREKQYMQSLVYDLANDTANLNAGFPLKEGRVQAIDSIFLFFELNPDVKIMPGAVYRLMQRSTWDRHYRRNSTTIDQLKNAGGMRLIRKKDIADSIAAYDLQWQRAEFWKVAYIANQEAGKSLIQKIFNANDLLSSYRNNSTGQSIAAKITDSLVISINTVFLNEYLNFLNHQKTTTIQDKQGYKRLEESAARLIELIKKEYHLN